MAAQPDDGEREDSARLHDLRELYREGLLSRRELEAELDRLADDLAPANFAADLEQFLEREPR